MAPPTPVLSREDVARMYKPPSDLSGCIYKSITQNNCSFEGGLVQCVPFKRVFRDCPVGSKGKRQVVEITDESTNDVFGQFKVFMRIIDDQ
ncbi:unnamed protein product [Cyberlindnera jadinii]|uniref:Uncharacterized protein n=2 Tax=Cyberlindnera jadinii (strain ATCC 18201 / CBS 1600 / BCRC 20928 / JCM 3617 / NBRC 0987 / NRRL Y-1542) TaxID=983966 RepID=A0A0H5C582_CYBJN|nr:unnamed protein product [Cyberlindnera jadinii]